MARTRTIKVSDLFDPIKIDFLGTIFSLRTPTRSTEEAASAKETELSEAWAKTAEEGLDEAESRKILMPIFYELFELLLEPAEHNGKKTHPKTVVKKLYEEDKIGLGHLRALTSDISRVREEERRPT